MKSLTLLFIICIRNLPLSKLALCAALLLSSKTTPNKPSELLKSHASDSIFDLIDPILNRLPARRPLLHEPLKRCPLITHTLVSTYFLAAGMLERRCVHRDPARFELLDVRFQFDTEVLKLSDCVAVVF